MKYYKILNENECHNGMQYKTGLNVDILPFNPKGDCRSGGIYCSYVPQVAAKNGHTAIVELLKRFDKHPSDVV